MGSGLMTIGQGLTVEAALEPIIVPEVVYVVRTLL